MASAARATFEGSIGIDFRSVHEAASETGAARPAASAHDVTFDIHDSLDTIEQLWRSFEAYADGTAFQTFEWLSAWQRHIGVNEGVRPAVVIGRDSDGSVLFLLPLTITTRRYGRVLSFLGSELCDYNAPLLAPDFKDKVVQPLALMQHVLDGVQRTVDFDVVCFEKMPEMVGEQPNPLMQLPAILHPSGAYLTQLGADWEQFYREKRSTSTRQRDRSKRKKLAQFGAVEIVHPATDDDVLSTLETLMAQKGKAFARMGVANIFANPDYRAFYRAVATDPATRHLVHVSRLQVGDEMAAVNLGLRFRERYYYVLASYGDGEMARFGPGAAHLRDLMQYAIGHGVRIFDFTVGDEPYKREWCDEIPLYDHIAGVSFRGRIVAAVLRAARALKRRIKRDPRLWKMAYRTREVLGRLRRQHAD